jgi:glycosyltransferase involved in cell wall biosynthesis
MPDTFSDGGKSGALNPPAPDVSVVIPVYKNKETLAELHGRLTAVLGELMPVFELIFVDDACPEGSLGILEEIARGDSRVAVMALEKNIGQHRAILAGLTQARGDWIVVLDADLQDPPEAIPRLLSKLQEGFAAVFAGRRGRYESPARLLSSRVFKYLLHVCCAVPADAGLFMAMTRQAADRLLAFATPHPFLTGMIGLTSAPLASIPVWRSARPRGRSAYGSWKRLTTGVRLTASMILYRWRPTASNAKEFRFPVKALIGVRYGGSTPG